MKFKKIKIKDNIIYKYLHSVVGFAKMLQRLLTILRFRILTFQTFDDMVSYLRKDYGAL